MLVEILFIQKFILFLNQTLYAIAVILSNLLIFSGIVHRLAGRFLHEEVLGRLRTIIFFLCTLLVIYICGLPVIFDTFLWMPGIIRLIISILLIVPLGIMMGMAFPLGIRLLEQDRPTMIPWVWGVNSTCLVMGSVVAWGLSLNFCYNITIWTAVLIYGCAFLVMILKPYSLQR